MSGLFDIAMNGHFDVPAFAQRSPSARYNPRRGSAHAFLLHTRVLQQPQTPGPGPHHPRPGRPAPTQWHRLPVVIAVDRTGGLPLDPDFRASLLAHLETYRMASYDLDLREPVHVPLDIGLELCLYPNANRTQVHRELHERLGSAPSGLFHPDRLTFGQRIYSSQIIAQSSAVAGVHSVSVIRFHRFRQTPGTELEDGFLEVQGLELPQLANHPSFPERGRIEFILKGGS